MTLRFILSLLLVASTVFSLSACDMPPDEISADTDSEIVETDSDTITDSETETVEGPTCVKAVLCLIFNPEEMLACFEGLEGEDNTAALDVSMCAVASCMDTADNLPNFGICLVQNCGPEAMECVQTSIAGALL